MPDKQTHLLELRHHDFTKHLNSTFTVTTGGTKTQKWKLVETTDVVSHGGGEDTRRHAFSVLFSGPGGSAVEQGVYKFKHPKMKNMEILVCPVAKEGGKRMHYEANFN